MLFRSTFTVKAYDPQGSLVGVHKTSLSTTERFQAFDVKFSKLGILVAGAVRGLVDFDGVERQTDATDGFVMLLPRD